MSYDIKGNLHIRLIRTLLAIEKETLNVMGIESVGKIEGYEELLQKKMRGFFAPKDPEEALRAAHKVADSEAGKDCGDGSYVEESVPEEEIERE